LEKLGDSPRTLLHGDLRLDNVCNREGKKQSNATSPNGRGVARERNLLYLDFGDCCAGRAGHDIGYFLSQSLEPAVRREHEKTLLHAYWGALHGSDADGVGDSDADDIGDMRERLAGYSFEDLVDDYKLGVLFNFCLAVAMVNLIEEGASERTKWLARTAIERAVQAIEDHKLDELLLENLS
jgi:hypothetical protein